MMPCNWKDNYVFENFNRNLDKTQNEVAVYDYNGTLLFTNVYETDEFTIKELNLTSGNYIVNLRTSEGGTSQQVIIVE